MTTRAVPTSRSGRIGLLSVIIPAYNAADTLGDQIDALKCQDYKGDSEVVVVDNGSTDGTAEKVRDYKRIMPNLRLVSAPEKQSSSYARNAGARAARGDAFLFCDADDVVGKGWISALAKALEEHDLVAGAIEMRSLNPEVASPHGYLNNGTKAVTLGFLPSAASCNAAISRQAFDAVHGFSEAFTTCVDVDFSWRLQLLGYEIHDAPSAILHRRRRKTLRARWKQAVETAMGQVNLYRHYAGCGMPRSSMREVLHRGKWLALHLRYIWSRDLRERLMWIQVAAQRWGRIRGSVRYRTIYL